VEREAGEVGEVLRVQGPEARAGGDGTGRDGRVDLPSARAADQPVELRREGSLRGAEDLGAFRGKEGLLRPEFRCVPRAPEPLVEDDRRERDPLAVLDGPAEVRRRSPRAGQRVDEEISLVIVNICS
jgi:hypothetical protein